MAKHYVYRMDHDTGFAPHISKSKKVCTLCGCKITTVEDWAKPGTWVIGIGGNGTGRRDSLIYAMRVEATPTLAQFRRQFPHRAAYLAGRSLKPSSRVLVARHFYYFGNKAITMPVALEHLIIRAQGCKKVADADVTQLDTHLTKLFGPGVHGSPNNPPRKSGRMAGCRRARSVRCQCVSRE
jgi:hypothetical protein